MKKRILGILTVVLALSMVFSMVSCGDKGGVTTKNYDITFDKGVILPSYSPVPAGAVVTLPEGFPVAENTAIPAGKVPKVGDSNAPTYAGHAFSGWVYSNNVPYYASDVITAATTLYALWTVGNTPATFKTVTFEGADGTVIKTVDVVTGTTVPQAQFPANPTKEGELFSGWIVKGGTTSFTPATVVSADVTVVPNFVAAGTTYTVTFEGADGSTVIKTVANIAPLGTVATTEFPADPTAAEGQEFVEWRIKGTTTKFTNTFQIVENTTVVAYFRASGGVNYVVLTFNVNWPAGVGGTPPVIEDMDVEENTPVGTLPTPSAIPDGFVFGGWWNAAGTTRYTETATFLEDTILYARWTPDTLTGDDADELLYLQNGASAVYQFDIPAGSSLADYKTLNVDYKVSAAALAVWDREGVGLFHLRLLGVYTSETPAADAADNNPPIKYIDRNNYSTPYIIDNSKTPSTVRNNVTANQWFTIEYDLSGASKHSDAVAANMPSASHTGTVYFALGLACQTTNGGKDRDRAFLQLVKDIKLVPKDAADEVPGVKPGADYGQFVAYNDPIVLEWRGEPTQANIDNPPLPEFVEAPFSRGDPPADADLTTVVLGQGTGDSVFSYINGGQVSNQRGWVSFGEAGRANSQISTVSSTVTFNNFINAWYLVLETTEAPTGTVALVWMGDNNGWRQNNVTTNTGEALDGISWITPVGDDPEAPDSYVLKFLLPESLLAYQDYFEQNKEWAGLTLSYWGANSHNVISLGVTKAYLLVATDEVEASATGASVGITFTLGSSAPAGGDIIVDVALNKAGNLLVSANLALGLTDYRWYVDGVLAEEAGNVLTLDAESVVVTLQAKRAGKWVSQAVNITVKSE